LEKLTKLPADVLEAVSTNLPADRQQNNAESEPAAAAAADSDTEDTRLADNGGKLYLS